MLACSDRFKKWLVHNDFTVIRTEVCENEVFFGLLGKLLFTEVVVDTASHTEIRLVGKINDEARRLIEMRLNTKFRPTDYGYKLDGYYLSSFLNAIRLHTNAAILELWKIEFQEIEKLFKTFSEEDGILEKVFK
ncbi:MAG: hypothetical protein AAB766_03340 [Patescibacteria group bacterium]